MEEQEAPGGVRTDLAYATITLGGSAIWSVVGSWLLYFYLPPEGHGVVRVPAALVGVSMFVAWAAHIAMNPAIGYWSDHLHTRWGRRLPIMFLASAPVLVLFVLLWLPPVVGQSGWNVVYLTAMLLLYNVVFSLNEIPYQALLPELARTERHRVRMSAWYAAFQLLGLLLAGCAGLLIDRWGYRTMALAYAGLALPLLYLPFLVLRERHVQEPPAAERLGFVQSISITLKNRAFQVFVAACMFYWIAMTFVQTAIPYIVTEVCLLTEGDAVYFYAAGVIVSLLCFPVVNRLASKLGKWRVMAGSLLCAAGVLPLLAAIGPWWGIPRLAQGLVWTALEAAALSGVTVLPTAFVAEITDHDRKVTGQRREGSYYAAWSVLDQLTYAIATGLLPLLLLLGRSSADPYGPLGVRLVGVVSGLCMMIAFLVFLRYPLRESRGAAGQAPDTAAAVPEGGHGA